MIIKIEKDSIIYKVLLECQNGKVEVKEVLKQKPSKNVNLPNTVLKDKVLIVDCEVYTQRSIS